MVAVSVIIPFYNVAPFIRRCAESLMAQTLQDVEFIFVDDASPDGSRKILEEVLAANPGRNARILTHEANRGLPAARNTGLAEASGDFIFHCDSDDWTEPRMLEKLYAAAVRDGADFVYCDFILDFGNGGRYMHNPTFTDPAALLKDGFLAGTTKYNVWNKLVRRELYRGISFPEGHAMGEDMTMIMVAAQASRAAHVPEALYHYVKLNTGAYSQTFSQKHLEDIRFNVERVARFLEDGDAAGIDRHIGYFKLNVKLPFLLSNDPAQYDLWRQWYPEADRYAMENKALPFRTRLLQWCAAKGLFRVVKLYGILVEKLYCLLYK